MAVKQKVVECVDPAASEARLQVLLRTLQDIVARDGLQREDDLDRDRVCLEIVSRLGTLQIPTDTSNYVQFMSDIKNVQEILRKECMNTNLMNTTLKNLCDEISDPTKQLSPAMSIVLQLIKRESIPDAVKWILNSGYSEQNLEQALYTLCNWLTKWTYTENLGPLVLEFMQGLEAEQHYYILMDVTLDTIESLFKLLVLKQTRESVGPVVQYMLSKVQCRPEVFHKIIPHVGHVIAFLDKDKSESSQYYLQKVVDLCIALMEHFPDFPVYEKLKLVLEPHYPVANYKQSLDCKSWSDGTHSGIPTRSSKGKVGLNNLGNTCYMNSVLQALFMTKLFRNEVLLLDKSVSPLFLNLQDLFVLLQHSQKFSLSPNNILHLARPPGFNLGHQHDSSEFLGYLLDVLHEQESSVLNKSIQRPTTSTDYAEMTSANITIVQQSFGGRTVTVSTCDTCRMKSEKVDNFRDLQLSFPNSSDNHSVTSLLHYYLQPEKLCGDNKYHCDTCNGLTDGERVTHIIEPPSRLILTLKHFGYDPVSQQKTKLLQRVNLEDSICLNGKNYELYAAVVHCGSSVDSGHYYTFAKDNTDWYKFNDCSVMKTTAAQLCDLKPPETAYILFYRKHDCEEPDNLPRSILSQRLQLVLIKDISEWETEKLRRSTRIYNTRQNRNDEPPPPGCGGGGFSDNTPNRYVC